MDRIQKLQSFLDINPHDSFLLHALALEWIKKGDIDTAVSLFKKILKDQPEHIGSYYHLGKLLERKGLINEAAEVYKKGQDYARKAGEKHAFNELRQAIEDLEGY
jgi:tetratricopeptide (TPR) repeat protein